MKKLLMTVAALFGAVQAWGATGVSTWKDLKDKLQAGTSVYLTGNITHSGSEMITVSNGKPVTLDLNGKTITCFNSSTSKRPFQVENSGSVLTITGSGTITGQNKKHTDQGGGFAWVKSGGKLVLLGGTVTKFKSVDGAAIYISNIGGGTVEMNGGTISDCTATGEKGGGGAVYVNENGTFTMKGGTISGCTAAGTSAHGGAVCLKSTGKFVMNGGTIKDCSAKWGGAFAILDGGGTATIYGGTMSGNSATNTDDGGSVFNQDSGTVTIYGGKFSGGGSAKYQLRNYSGTFYLYGGVFANFKPSDKSVNISSWGGNSQYAIGSQYVVGKNVVTSGDKVKSGSFTFNPSSYVTLYPYSTVSGSGTDYTVHAPYTVTVQAVNGANVSVSGSGQTGSAAGSYLVPKGGWITATYSAQSGYVMMGSSSVSASSVTSDKTLDASGIKVGVNVSIPTVAHARVTKIEANGTTYDTSSSTVTVQAGTGITVTYAANTGYVLTDSATASLSNVAANNKTLDVSKVTTVQACGVYNFVKNGDFADNDVASGSWKYGATAAPWTLSTHAGIDNKSKVWITGAPYDGAAAFLQKGYIYQQVYFPVDGTYLFRFQMVLRGATFTYPDGTVNIEARLGDTTSAQTGEIIENCCLTSATSWTQYNVQKTVSRGWHYLQFYMNPGSGDPCACVDNIEVTLVNSTSDPVLCYDWAGVCAVLDVGMNAKLAQDISIGTAKDQAFWRDSSTAADVSLDLNGKKIDAYDGSTTGGDKDRLFVFCNTSKFKLTINDSAGGGSIVGHQQGENHDGGMIWIDGSSQLVLNGGAIFGFSMTGGGGWLGNGGTIFVNSGSFTMNGGTISGSSATVHGGAIYSKGTVMINGGTISSSTAVKHGGGVFIDSAGTFTMNGGTIENCAAGSNYTGGGVFVNTGGTFTMNGGVLLGNTVGGSATAETALFGGSGTTTVNGGVSDSSLIGNKKASDKSCTQVGSNWVVGKGIASDANNTLTGGTYTFNPANAEYAAAGVAIATGKAVLALATTPKTWTVRDEGIVGCSTWAEVKTFLESGYDVKLAQDIAQDNDSIVTLNGTQNVTLDLNGRTITQGIIGTTAAYIIQCSSGSAKVTIKDSVGGGAIVGNATQTTSGGSGGGGFYFGGSSSLTLESGTLKDFRLTADEMSGGCIYVNSGASFTMNGGTITNCTTSWEGGAVFSSGTFTMNGGTISGCSASRNGGAVYNNWGTVTMNDGTISGCSASWNGGAVYNRGAATIYARTISGCTASGNGGALGNYGTANVYGGSFTGNYARTFGGFCGSDSNCSTSIYGGYFGGNKSTGFSLYYGGISYSASIGKLYGGVFDADPTSSSQSESLLVLQNSAKVTQVGANYVVGKDVTTADGTLTGGTYTFNPANAEYAAAVALAEDHFAWKTGEREWKVIKATKTGDTTWAYLHDGTCDVFGASDMPDYTKAGQSALWAKSREIRSVVIGAGVTSVGSHTFAKFYGLTNVTVAASVTNVGEAAFLRCLSLEKLAFEAEQKDIAFGKNAYVIHAGIKMEGGVPVVYPVPEVTFAGKPPALYGKAALADGEWTEVTDENKGGFHFFTFEPPVAQEQK